MTLKNIPQDLNIELLLSYLPQGTCKVRFGGLHKRNTYHDLVELAENADNTLELTVGRNSLYHVLPEYMFHPIDRFGDSTERDEQERFQKEYEAQKEEVENAQKFFAPLDLMLLQLQMDIREKLSVYTDTDKIIIDLIGDRMTEKQKQNRFIRQIIPLLPSCRNIRGNNTLITLLLRKIFLNEDLLIETQNINHTFNDFDHNNPEKPPRYQERLPGEVGSIYLGHEFQEQVTTYTVHYWSDDECNENFLKFIDEIEELRAFIQDYFIALDNIIRFDIVKDEEPLRLSDPEKYNYLNYNTNL